MRAMPLAQATVLALLFVAARADVPASSAEPATPATETSAAAQPAPDRPFEPPPGFKSRKRGKYVVYCRTEPVRGTRLPAEVCYDEDGIRTMLQAQQEDREKVEQIRRVNGTTIR